MANIALTWKPNKRNITYAERPEWVPNEIYQVAVTSKRKYNEDWEFWVWEVAQNYNVSQAEAEDACIRGIKKEFYKIRFIYGPRVGQWFEEYLDMGDIFSKVKHPEYLPELGYRQGSMSIEVKDGTRKSESESE